MQPRGVGHQPFGLDLDAIHRGVADVSSAEVGDATRVLRDGADLLVVVAPVKRLHIDQQAIGEQPVFEPSVYALRCSGWNTLESLEKKNPPDLKPVS